MMYLVIDQASAEAAQPNSVYSVTVSHPKHADFSDCVSGSQTGNSRQETADSFDIRRMVELTFSVALRTELPLPRIVVHSSMHVLRWQISPAAATISAAMLRQEQWRQNSQHPSHKTGSHSTRRDYSNRAPDSQRQSADAAAVLRCARRGGGGT